MAVFVQSRSESVGTLAGPMTLVEPNLAQQGDMLIAFALCQGGSRMSAPLGWTTLYTGTVTNNTDWIVSYINRGASAPSLSWTYTGNVYRECFIVCLRSDDPNAIGIKIDSRSASGTTGVGPANPNAPATTAVAANVCAISGGMDWGGSTLLATPAWVEPVGYALQSDNTPGSDGYLMSAEGLAAGTVDPGQMSGVGTAGGDFWNGFTVTVTDDFGINCGWVVA